MPNIGLGTPIEQGCEGLMESGVHTLAQPDQNLFPSSPQSVLQKRAHSKFASLPLAVRLAEVAKLNGSPLQQSYRNTVYCASCINQKDGKLTARYCGNRWCTVCCRVRTARAIEAYGPILDSWTDPYMVGLSLVNCQGPELKAQIEMMLKGFESCKRSIKRTHGLEFKALRKLECTDRGRRGYHPHFHVIVNGKEQAELLQSIWLKRFPESAGPKGQWGKPCRKGTYLELFKYFTKLTTKVKNKWGGWLPAEALDVIFQAMHGHRVWQAVGFTLPEGVTERIEGEVLDVEAVEAFKGREESALWYWTQAVHDWVNELTGEVLSGYVPPPKWEAFVWGILPEGAARDHPALADWWGPP